MNIVAKNSGKKLEVQVEKIHCPPTRDSYIRFKLFGEVVEFHIVENRKSLVVNTFQLKKVEKQINAFFNTKIKTNARLCIVVTDQSWDEIQEEIAVFETENTAYLEDFHKRANEMPVRYEAYDLFDMGDYAVNNEREIVAYRDPLPEEGDGPIRQKVYGFWNSGISTYVKEWKSDFPELNEAGTSIEISNELAEKWINIHDSIKNEAEKVEAEKAEIRESKRQEEAERVAACFAEAKATQKPVVLFSCFISGNDIPKQFRDEDSDMGNIITYAMPDGSQKEMFHHSH